MAPLPLLWTVLVLFVVTQLCIACLAIYATGIDGSGLLLLPALLVGHFGIRRIANAIATTYARE